MGEKKGEELYCNISRKDIQGLCKKYGLPANKSSLEMATSLILYLEKKNLSSRTMWEATRSDPCPSGTSELRIGAGIISTGDQRKDCRGPGSHSGSGKKRHDNQDVQQNDSQKCRGTVTSDKASENTGILTHLCRDSIHGLPENTFSSVVSSPVAAHSPDFQFDVHSEDGIQLCVDFNSTPSDWIENMKSGVHICQCHDVNEHRSQGLQNDPGLLCSKQMRSSSFVDSDKEMNDGNSDDGSSPTTTGTGLQAQVGEPDAPERSLYFTGLKSCSNTVHSQEDMGERQAISSSMQSDRGKEVNIAKSCEREDQAMPTTSAVNAVTQIRTFNFSGNSLGPKYSGVLANHVLNVADDVYANSSVQQSNGHLNPSLKYMVSPASGSMEIKASRCTTLVQDVASPPSRTGTSMHPTDQIWYSEREHCGLPQSTQFHGNVHQMQSFERADVSRYVTFSSKSGSIENEHSRGSVSRKSSGQVTEVPTHQAYCHRENMSLSPPKSYGSLGVVRLDKIEAENGGFLRQRQPGQEAVDVHSSMVGIPRDGALLFPCSNGVSVDLVAPEQNGMNHRILTCANELDPENCKIQPATCVGNLGTSNVGDARQSSEDLMEKTCMDSPNSESNGELKRKRQFHSFEEQSDCLNSDSRISRNSKQLSGDVHASRRRSSRLFTK